MTLSNRLACCAALVAPGSAVADIGTDHGYLAISLLQQGKASYVTAADLRAKPLEKARHNAENFGLLDRITFVQCDGLEKIRPDAADTIICAGMGGDTIAHILDACVWAKNPQYRYILQPQTSGNDLRRYLGNHGYQILEEHLVEDGGRIYFVMLVQYGGGVPFSPGEQYLSPVLLRMGGALLPAYFARVIGGLRRAVTGISQANCETERQRLAYYQTALQEVLEMKVRYDNGQ